MSLMETFLTDALTNPLPVSATPAASRRTVYIALRNDGAKGSGTPDDPYNGSNPGALDELLNEDLGGVLNLAIRFGPGIFQTRGFGVNYDPVGWQIRNGWQISGSGIYATTLQLLQIEPNSETAAQVGLIGGGATSTAPLSNVEICDLTLDANIMRQPLASDGEPALMTLKGMGALYCSNVTMRRVRIINWGPHCPGVLNGDLPPGNTWECFPINLFGGTDALIKGFLNVENCIIEQPTLWPSRESTMINCRGSADWSNEPTTPVDWWTEVMGTTRDCYLSGDFTTGFAPPAVQVLSATHASNEVRIKTRWPHRVQGKTDSAGNTYSQGDQIVITGSAGGVLDGRHTLDLPTIDDFEFKFTKTGSGAVWAEGMQIQRYVPEPMLVLLSFNSSTKTVTVTTPKPHLRKAGDFIRISGVLSNAFSTPDNNQFNGCFKVVLPAVFDSSSTTLTYEVEASSPGLAGTQGPIWIDRWPSKKVGIISATAVAGELDVGEITAADSHYKAIGDYVRIQGLVVGNVLSEQTKFWNGWFKVLENSWSSTKMRVQTYAPSQLQNATDVAAGEVYNHFHGLSPQGSYGGWTYGNRVIGVTRGGPYHDTYDVKTVITWQNHYYNCFTGVLDQCEQVWTSAGHIADQNIIDLAIHIYGMANIHPIAVGLVGKAPRTTETGEPNPYWPSIEMAAVRSNYVQFAGNMATFFYDAGRFDAGARIDSGRSLTVQENIIGLGNTNVPVWFRDCDTPDGCVFNNRSPAGVLLQGKKNTLAEGPGIPTTRLQEMQTYADDVVINL